MANMSAAAVRSVAPNKAAYSLATAQGISLRPVAPDDGELLYQIYASTRTDELASVPWTTEQKETFLRSQSHAQETHYARHYRDATFEIILADGLPCGRLYLNRGANEIRIVDITLLPAFRGRGWGTAILRDIHTQAIATHASVTIHVEHTNPARCLYDRLGFEIVIDKGMHLLMRWTSAAFAATPSQLVQLQ